MIAETHYLRFRCIMVPNKTSWLSLIALKLYKNVNNSLDEWGYFQQLQLD